MNKSRTIKAGIVGGTGYAGVELLRILTQHPQIVVKVVTSRADAGRRVDEVYPSLRGAINAVFCQPNVDALSGCDVVFFATPHGIAMKLAKALLDNDVKVIDLSADFRLRNPDDWERWYGEPHASPELLKEAVYGLPEVHRNDLVNARLVACPGCYPTAVQLGFLPLLEAGLIDSDNLIADVKSGVSGAGRKAQVASLMSEVGESFKAYSVKGHRHHPEIEQGLEVITKRSVGLTFVPHLTPMIRGIHATLYCYLTDRNSSLQELFENRYVDEPFVDVLPEGSHPDTCDVRGGNRCQIAVHQPGQKNVVVVLSVIDNLVKGAAGQAVQAMNIVFGLDEGQGLPMTGLYP
ncbi:MAG: N-acetyl-gamma-glutamyl-phosphate reductase [Methylococcales bacterium]